MGTLLGITSAVAVHELVMAAWAVCDEAEAGARFAIRVEAVMVAGAIGLLAFIVVMALGRAPRAIAWSIAAILACSITLAIVAAQIPAYGEAAYGPDPASAPLPECGPYGIPTWWPAWLPS